MVQNNRQIAECSVQTKAMSSHTPVVMLKMNDDGNNDGDAGGCIAESESAPLATQRNLRAAKPEPPNGFGSTDATLLRVTLLTL